MAKFVAFIALFVSFASQAQTKEGLGEIKGLIQKEMENHTSTAMHFVSRYNARLDNALTRIIYSSLPEKSVTYTGYFPDKLNPQRISRVKETEFFYCQGGETFDVTNSYSKLENFYECTSPLIRAGLESSRVYLDQAAEPVSAALNNMSTDDDKLLFFVADLLGVDFTNYIYKFYDVSMNNYANKFKINLYAKKEVTGIGDSYTISIAACGTPEKVPLIDFFGTELFSEENPAPKATHSHICKVAGLQPFNFSRGYELGELFKQYSKTWE